MFWQTMAGRSLYQSQSGIHIDENYFFRWLSFGNNTIQSLIYKKKPEKICLKYLKAFMIGPQFKVGPTCLMGLGGGALIHSLVPYLNPMLITSIETNQEIIELSYQYFMLDKIPRLKIIHQDANQFIHETTEFYQHILIDLYEADHFPTSCFNEEFFIKCGEHLKNQGYLAVNLANRQEQPIVYSWLKKIFLANTLVIPIQGTANIVILASHSKNLSLLIEQQRQLKNIKKHLWDSNWGQIVQLK
ncbi:MAG: spermidine synthase [Bacteroidota bacterium]|nr:spermidine synthase [Bacteroidota bacterium]